MSRHVLHLREPRAGEAPSGAEERAWVREQVARSAQLKAEAAPGSSRRLTAAHSASHLAAELWPEHGHGPEQQQAAREQRDDRPREAAPPREVARDETEPGRTEQRT